MKKIIAALAALFAVATLSANADSYTYSATLTNGQPITLSDALPVSGWLDKIEVSTDYAATTTITVATFTAGGLPVDTFYSDTISATTNTAIGAGQAFDVARTRTLATDNTGTAIAAVGGGTNSSTFTGLSASYERPMIGGNVKVALTGTKNDGSNPVTVTIFYEPIRK